MFFNPRLHFPSISSKSDKIFWPKSWISLCYPLSCTTLTRSAEYQLPFAVCWIINISRYTGGHRHLPHLTVSPSAGVYFVADIHYIYSRLLQAHQHHCILVHPLNSFNKIQVGIPERPCKQSSFSRQPVKLWNNPYLQWLHDSLTWSVPLHLSNFTGQTSHAHRKSPASLFTHPSRDHLLITKLIKHLAFLVTSTFCSTKRFGTDCIELRNTEHLGFPIIFHSSTLSFYVARDTCTDASILLL